MTKLAMALLFLVSSAAAGPCILCSNATERHDQYVESATVLASSLGGRDRSHASEPSGPYTAKYGRIAKVPGLTMGGKTSAVIVYPSVIDEKGAKLASGNNMTNTSTFPLLSFAHAT